jgi:hypothetical protein
VRSLFKINAMEAAALESRAGEMDFGMDASARGGEENTAHRITAIFERIG